MPFFRTVSWLLAAVAIASANHGDRHLAKRHQGRAISSSQSRNVTRRGDTYTGRATWFPPGLGACGDWSQPGDMMVALNYLQYGDGYPGPNCFRSITIEYNGQQQVATILDECPPGSCDAWGQLDLAPGLFTLFMDQSFGEFQMTWWYNDDPPDGQVTTSSTDPAPWTSTQTTTTTSWSDPAPWTTDTPTSTTTTTASAVSTSTTSTTITASSGSATGDVSLGGTPTTLNIPSGTATHNNDFVENLDAMNELVVGFGDIVEAGGQ